MQKFGHYCLAAIIALSFLVNLQAEKPKKTTKELEMAFARDGYDVIKVVEFEGMRGILAEHKTAVNYETKKRKKAYYVEGNGYQMGYLMGVLAEEEISWLCEDFIDYVLFDFLDVEIDPKKIPEIMKFFKDLVAIGSKKSMNVIPQEYAQEVQGMVDGCQSVNADTKTTYQDLIVVNTGIDVLLSKVYALNNIWETEKNVPFTPEDIRIPVLCNAFSVFGKATADGKHYFGRDFMFPTAKVFHHTAALTIFNPTDGRIPLVSMAAPGFFGSMAAMNKEGIAMGVDMVPGGNCNGKEPGMNSLPIVRHAMHQGNSAKNAIKAVERSERGVSWLFPLADGKNDCSAVIESGMNSKTMDFMKYVPKELQHLLPDQAFLDRHENQKHKSGLMVRWNDYKYPEEFQNFNNELFTHHNKKQSSKSWGMLLHTENL